MTSANKKPDSLLRREQVGLIVELRKNSAPKRTNASVRQ
jgi:hypothetical protein